MFVILNEVSPRALGPLTLKPKLNKGVDGREWAKVSGWSTVEALRSHRLIEELAEDAPNLDGLQVASAILVVNECNFDQFLRWQKVEARGPVQHAMKKRLDGLKQPTGQDSVAARAFEQGVSIDEIKKQDASYGSTAERLTKAEAKIEDQARYIRELEARLVASEGRTEVTQSEGAVVTEGPEIVAATLESVAKEPTAAAPIEPPKTKGKSSRTKARPEASVAA